MLIDLISSSVGSNVERVGNEQVAGFLGFYVPCGKTVTQLAFLELRLNIF